MQHPQWTDGVHHDGSARYVSNPLPTLNDVVEIQLRVPKVAPVNRVYIRSTPDGEQHFTLMSVSQQDDLSVWYSASLPMQNRRTRYRFKLMTDDGAYVYNAAGVYRADVPDYNDFKLLADFENPDWLTDAVFYQIFPERFYNGDPSLNPPEGEPFEHPPFETFTTQMRHWHTDEPLPFKEGGTVDFFGGDLPGIEQKLGYLTDLGVNALYLNPVFDSPSNHKYNISDFYTVDPHFGGNDALASLSHALKQRGMYYVLDLTPNHTGDTHEWFQTALADETAATTAYYTFYEYPQDYEAWLGVATLPKLNYNSQALRAAMYRDDNSVMRYWLKPPFNADGWRLDVWNMTAVQREHHHQHAVGREMRAAVKQTNPQAYLFGEHFFDGTASLQGDEMDAMMNYQGFSFPLWRWLAGHDLGNWHEDKQGYSDDVPLPAEAATAQMRRFMAAIPWAIARLQFNQLGSHDTPRILSVVNNDERLAKLATTVLLTYPGVPCVYYGDEIGMQGWSDPDNRHPMRWNESDWNTDMRDHYKTLIDLRRNAHALTHGGMQFLHAAGDVFAYLRESTEQRALIVAARAAGEVIIPVTNGNIPDGTTFTDALSEETFTVADGQLSLRTTDSAAGWVLFA